MKLIEKTIINQICQQDSNLNTAERDTVSKQKISFLVRYSASENLLCQVFTSNAECEIKALRQK